MTPGAPPLSRFLPASFDARRPLALLAGKGTYPKLIHARARALGVPVRLLAFEDETDADLIAAFPESERRIVNIGQLGKSLATLESFGSGFAVMAGQITPRKLFRGLTPDFRAVLLLARLKERNAETIFGALGDEMARRGVTLLDARAFMDDHLATAGVMTGGRLQVADESLAHGIRIAREIARLDIGQGCVVSRGTVVAVEAFEGTNEMLRRAGTFGAEDLLFVKAVKPGQDYRIDVPVFGQRTLEVMKEAGIGTAALEADTVIVLERAGVVARARDWGIQLIGFPPAPDENSEWRGGRLREPCPPA